jgi:hypothetical protein
MEGCRPGSIYGLLIGGARFRGGQLEDVTRRVPHDGSQDPNGAPAGCRLKARARGFDALNRGVKVIGHESDVGAEWRIEGLERSLLHNREFGTPNAVSGVAKLRRDLRRSFQLLDRQPIAIQDSG